MDPAKVQAVADRPQPRSTCAVHGFVGLAGYYRKFIKDFDIISTPLTNLLRKERFAFTDEVTSAFTALKDTITSAPVLGCL